MSNPQPTSAKASSSRLPSSIPSSISSSKRSSPFEQEETTFDQPPSPSPPPSSYDQYTASTTDSKPVKPSPYFGSSADGVNHKTNPSSSSKDWKPKDEAPSREKALKRLVLNPSHPSNPITSRTGQNAIDVVVSASTGHQARAYGPNSRTAAGYFQVRQEKLKEQAAGKRDEIFKGVRVWLDGYLGVGVTNLEVKAAVNSHGGTVSEYPGQQVTHILTHEPLSASKNHSFLTKHKGWNPHVVSPLWVYASVDKGMKLDVFKYLILNPCDQPRIASFFGAAKPQQQQEPQAKRPKLVGAKSASSSSTATPFSSSSSLGSRSRSAPSISKASSTSTLFSKFKAVKGNSRSEAIEID